MTAKGRSRATSGTRRALIRLMVVDDHPIWRDTLRNILEAGRTGQVVAEAGDGGDAVTQAEMKRPDVVLMDINLPNMDGIAATREVLSRVPETKVLVLASSDERGQVVRAVQAGASGYLLKTAEPDDVVDAVRRVHKGELVFPAALANVVLEELRRGRGAPSIRRVAVAVPAVLEREGLATVLEHAGVDLVASVEKIEDVPADVDVVIVDEGLLASVRDVDAAPPNVGILVLTRKPSSKGAVDLLSRAQGRAGYLSRERISRPDEILAALERVADGEPVVDADVVDDLVERPSRKRRAFDDLTAREREVLGLMAEGHSNQAIAGSLHLGSKTVEAHVRSIFMKLGLEPAPDVHRRVLAVLTYLRST